VELNCPKCDGRLDLVLFPTSKEDLAAAPNLITEERQETVAVSRSRLRYEALCLKTPDQLPYINDVTIVLTWDRLGVEGDYRIEIRHGSRVIWREPAVYEGYERFAEVLAILCHRYGDRLYELVPTRASALYLLGDSFFPSDRVKQQRKSLREKAESR
jgi:hypothetical protein